MGVTAMVQCDYILKFDWYCQLSGSGSNHLNLWKLPGRFSYGLGTRLKSTQRPTGKDVSNTWANAITGDKEMDTQRVLQLPVVIRIIISIPPGSYEWGYSIPCYSV